LMPGFVDAHHHLTQTFGKALAFGEPSECLSEIILNHVNRL
jgi:5-methylthioadenosine/S-adenosylhomocysteine deaminase